MARHRRPQVECRVRPYSVIGTFAKELAAVIAQVALEIAALQAATVIVMRSTWPAPIGGSRPSSR